MISASERLRKVMTYGNIKCVEAICVEACNDFILNVSDIAKANRISSSTVSNGLRLLEAAGTIETHSVGVKGTHIIVHDRKTLEKLL